MNPEIVVFITSFFTSAIAGFASLLRSGEVMGRKNILTYTLNSGILGLGICFLWYNRYIDNPFYLVGLCIFVGLTGIKGVDLVLGWAQKFSEVFLNNEVKK